MMIKVGQGFDVHQLVSGRKCIIGGVEIPFHKGLDGHSDADVLDFNTPSIAFSHTLFLKNMQVDASN